MSWGGYISLIFDIAKIRNKSESCIFRITFLSLKNIKSLIIRQKEIRFGKL